jgi:hypothetical protein
MACRFTDTSQEEEVAGPVNAQELTKTLESKGSIRMEFRFITNSRHGQALQRQSRNPLAPMDAIPEKALKGDARSHQATCVICIGTNVRS